MADADPQALGVTYWFDAAPDGRPYPLTVHFEGRRIGVKGKPRPRDRFSVVETVDRVLPGSGRIALTARISDIAPGHWHVTATPVKQPRSPVVGTNAEPARQVSLPRGSSSGITGFAPVINVRAPGARLGAWPALVGVGVAVALSLQLWLADRAGLPTGRALTLSLVASVIGLVGAKLYWLAEQRGRVRSVLTAGLCIQGFVLGAIGTLLVGGPVADVPAGPLLDVTTPGLLFGMTIGRFGCFFGGCCAGRPTSRRGLWSSDRRIGVRRIPTQLFESGLALSIGLVALLAVWRTDPGPAGVVFVGGIAAYTLGRQLLFPLRDVPRRTRHGRNVTMLLAALTVVTASAAALA